MTDASSDTKKDFAKLITEPAKEFVANAFYNISGLSKLDKLLDETINKDSLSFADNFLENLKIRLNFNDDELKRIPTSGPVIIVSNYTIGLVSEIILLKLMKLIRPDFKIISEYPVYSKLKLKDHCLVIDGAVGDFSDPSNDIFRKANNALVKGEAVIVFPGDTRKGILKDNILIDGVWNINLVRFIKYSQIPVVPIYMQNNAKPFFQILEMINPAKVINPLPVELIKLKNTDVNLKIGLPISSSEISQFDRSHRFGRFLRSKTYSLGSAIEVKKFFLPPIKMQQKAEEIAKATDKSIIENEIKNIQNQKIVNQQNFEIYYAEASSIPNIINEIGRLREITFRQVGEGTNKALDLDEYDLYYNHLFLWDSEEKQIAGAYRVGKGAEIYSRYGKKGFYTSSLFNFDPKFHAVLKQTMELGRSFVLKEYQQKRLPLFLLWKGIMFFILSNPEYRYLLGPVSISNNYSKVSKSIIVSFIQKNFYDKNLAGLVKPKKRFKPDFKNLDSEPLLENSKDDVRKIDKILQDMEPERFSMPVLLKKYIKENAKIICFNIDPKFNNALDGLMILDLNEVKDETKEIMKKDLNIYE